MSTPVDRSDQFVQSLGRGLSVIKAFDAEHQRLTLSDVARRTGLTRAAARRFLHTLVALGYVRSEGRHFTLRARILDLGYAHLSELSLPDAARPHLRRLSADVGESVSVSILDGDDIVYVARVATRRLMTVDIGVGTRFPAHATSMGRVLLAGQPDEWLDGFLARTRFEALTPYTVTDPDELRTALTRARQQGWALADQELEVGLRSVAAPLRTRHGTVAAVNISAPVRRGTAEDLVGELLPPLLATTREINADLAVLP